MGAFIIGGIVFLGAVALGTLIIFAAGMSDSPTAAQGAGRQALSVLIGGLLLSALIIGTHWMPHIGW